MKSKNCSNNYKRKQKKGKKTRKRNNRKNHKKNHKKNKTRKIQKGAGILDTAKKFLGLGPKLNKATSGAISGLDKLNSKLEGLLTKFGDKRVELKKDVVSRYNKTMGLFQKNLKAITDRINVDAEGNPLTDQNCPCCGQPMPNTNLPPQPQPEIPAVPLATPQTPEVKTAEQKSEQNSKQNDNNVETISTQVNNSEKQIVNPKNFVDLGLDNKL